MKKRLHDFRKLKNLLEQKCMRFEWVPIADATVPSCRLKSSEPSLMKLYLKFLELTNKN